MAAVKNIHGFTLDVKRPSRVSVSLVAGDTGNRFNIVIANGGVPMTGFTRVVAAFTRADGLVYTQDSAVAGNGVTANGSVVNIDLFASSYCAGKNTCELQLYSTGTATDDTLVTTAVFSFFARAAAVNDSSIQSSAQFPALVETVYSIDNMTIDAETLAYGAQATATVSEQDGVKHIHLGVPKGTPSVLVSDSVSPTSSTAGVVGQFYLNIALGHVVLYVCTSSEDSVYIWAQVYDSAASVASVNGQTGTVALDADDVGALPATKNGDVYELTGGLAVSGGATVNGRVQADSLTVLGDSDVIGTLSAEVIYSRDGVYAGGRVWGLVSPQSGTDAATKDYVDSVSGGAVSSVNGKTGTVVLDASDVGASPSVLTSATAPTAETVGEVGQICIACGMGVPYTKQYICMGQNPSGGYMWNEFGKNGSGQIDAHAVTLDAAILLGEQATTKNYVDIAISTAITAAIEGSY